MNLKIKQIREASNILDKVNLLVYDTTVLTGMEVEISGCIQKSAA